MEEGLTDQQKQEIQERFAHVLRSYRYTENLTQSELAEKIGFTLPYIAKLENKKAINNKAITSLEFLQKFTRLSGDVPLHSFVAYLKDGGFSATGSPWDSVVTDVFPQLRSTLLHKALSYFKRNKKKIDTINDDLTIMCQFVELSEEEKSVVKGVIKSMRGKK